MQFRRTMPPFNRTAGVAGILFVVLVLAGFVVSGDMPDADAPSAVIAQYYARDAGPAKAASTLSALALVPFAVFVAGLLVAVRGAERQDEGWSIVGIIGTAVLVAAVLAASGVNAAMAIGARALQTAPALTGTLYDLQSMMLLGLVVLGFALTAGGFSIAGARTGALPLSLCSLGIISSLFAVLGGVFAIKSVQGSNLGSIGFIAFLMFLVWSLLLGIDMVRRQPAPAVDDVPVPKDEPTPALSAQA